MGRNRLLRADPIPGRRAVPDATKYGSFETTPRGAGSQDIIDWDDVRYFLPVARGGSVRPATERLGVNHSTVLRRIAQLEERLGGSCLRAIV
jgi:hypothetical protein